MLVRGWISRWLRFICLFVCSFIFRGGLCRLVGFYALEKRCPMLYTMRTLERLVETLKRKAIAIATSVVPSPFLGWKGSININMKQERARKGS